MAKSYEGLLKDNAVVGAELIGQYLRGERPGAEDIGIASVAISQFNRFLGTKGAYKSLAFQIARSMTEDKDELRKLIKQENTLLT